MIGRKIPKPLLTLILANNTGSALPVQLLMPDNPNDIANQRTKYRWDITGISYAVPTVTITFWPVGSSGAFTTLTGTMLQANAQGLINLLNSFNNGSFWLETSGGNTYLVTYNDSVVYGNLSVGVGTTSIAWANNAVSGTLGASANLVVIFTSSAPPQSGSATVNDGDNILVTTGWLGGSRTLFITKTLRYPPFTTTTLLNITTGGPVQIFGFVADANYTYSITFS